jgi:hypothetical protein
MTPAGHYRVAPWGVRQRRYLGRRDRLLELGITDLLGGAETSARPGACAGTIPLAAPLFLAVGRQDLGDALLGGAMIAPGKRISSGNLGTPRGRRWGNLQDDTIRQAGDHVGEHGSGARRS